MDFFENKFFLLAITFGFFFISKLLQKKTGWVLLNPILIAIALLICFLKLTGVSYETYSEAGSLVEFWLKPAVVALGVPLYLQLKMIRKQLMPIVVSQLAGCIVGLVSVTVIAKVMGASPEVVMSLAPKSVTTPIAMGISEKAGGIPSLTAVIVVAVGIFGSIIGPFVLKILGIESRIAKGLALGASSHAVGTAAAIQIGAVEGAISGLAIGLMGIMTAVLVPIIEYLVSFF